MTTMPHNERKARRRVLGHAGVCVRNMRRGEEVWEADAVAAVEWLLLALGDARPTGALVRQLLGSR